MAVGRAFRGVVRQTQFSASQRGGDGRRVADRHNRAKLFLLRCLHNFGGGDVGFVETQRQCAVAPRIVETVAAVGAEAQFQSEFLGGRDKRLGLVTRGCE